MIKRQLLLVTTICWSMLACNQSSQQNSQTFDAASEKKAISLVLDSLNKAAGNADFDRYFSYYADDAVFAGTDATERWDKNAFMAWAKPIFDKGAAWNFTAINRNIYFNKSGELAWFDELLNTQMKICRGSGVLIKDTAAGWKIQQYILSTTVPNEVLDTVIAVKAAEEDALLKKLGTQ